MGADLISRIENLDEAGRAALDAFLTSLEDIRAAVPGSGLPGLPSVPQHELDQALARNAARVWDARKEVYDQGLDRETAANRAGVSPNQITNLLRDGHLLSLDGTDGLRLPAWQFDPEAKRGRLDGIGPVAEAFPGGVLGLTSWVEVPNPILGGRTPRQALLDGDVEAAIVAAESIGR